MISPTVGRVVLYRAPETTDLVSLGDQPMVAQILYVHSDREVNLLVTDHIGNVRYRPNIVLLQGADEYSPFGEHCEWMPFQKGQAAAADTKAVVPAKKPVTPAPDA